ncbi:type II toxin-antitoxin system RelE/ParE family toxin [Methylobacterium indicum]|uniref:Plasmid stabilization protein n=1 Tax=Methylobacterium indicum TaxID=1775910 RepID=A0ABR5HDK9_9HYPH|nr:type II toxin-antitoxin system RelE/ParE family toxin [Methylobacterium indicum]KMO10838.1 plasmid stabilization protein [Methylobacterium indicum]KMO24270.1 plasmid stabilization protein [Methylobacterium indicum]
MKTIRRTRRAAEDLIDIWSTVAGDDPSAADRLLDAIEQRQHQLRMHPYSGVSREEIAPGLRHLVIGQYLILYRVEAEAIEIVRVLHGRRKLDRSIDV